MTAKRLWRRLITLIYAGRDRRVMIRREMPRTEVAGWAEAVPHRTEEGSPFRGPLTATGAAVQTPILVQAAFETRYCCSIFTAMAHTNPSNSRPSAVTI